jgi:subtilisin family serine protease
MFGRRGCARRLKPRTRRGRLMLEFLEDRTLPAGIGVNPAVLVPEHLENQILVRFAQGSDATAVIASTQTDTSLGEQLLDNIYVVHLGGTTTVADALTAYQANPFVVYAEPDYIWHADLIPNDTLFGQEWGMNNTGQNGGTPDADIDAPEAWDVTTDAPGVVVAVIDTGIKWDHPDLAANIWTNVNEIPNNGIDDDGNGYIDDTRGWDFVNNDNNPTDDHGHGTHCAGTIGAVGNNGQGVAGVVWNVQLMPLKFLDASGSGTTSSAIKAVTYANRNGAKISSNSWGGGGFSQALYDAIKTGRDTYDTIFVAAAGNAANNNDANPSYPASYDLDNIVSVAATDRNDLLAGFSNYGATSVDLAAPGVSIVSTWNNNGYNTISGTSMATPHVSGAVAMIRGAFPGDSYKTVINRLLANVDVLPNLSGKVATSGRLRLEGLVPPPSGGLGGVGDFVWNDLNKDGRQDPGEPGVPLGYTTVHLYDGSGNLFGSTTTLFQGQYSFTNVPVGQYRLKFDLRSGSLFSPKDVGDDLGDSDVDAAGWTDFFQIQANVTLTTMDAGQFVPFFGGGGIVTITSPPPGPAGGASGGGAGASDSAFFSGGGGGTKSAALFSGGSTFDSAVKRVEVSPPAGQSLPTTVAVTTTTNLSLTGTPAAPVEVVGTDPTSAVFASLGLSDARPL